MNKGRCDNSGGNQNRIGSWDEFSMTQGIQECAEINRKFTEVLRSDCDFQVKSEWKLRLFFCLPGAPVQSLPPPRATSRRRPCTPAINGKAVCIGNVLGHSQGRQRNSRTKRLKTISLKCLPLLRL